MNRVGRLLHIAVKESRLVVGLMSGTSVDGIDAALVEIAGHGDAAKVKLLAFDSYPFPPELRARVFRLFNPREARVDAICQLDFLLGEVFAAAVERLLRDHNIDREDVDIVASAGQTIWHDPEPVVVKESVDWIDHPIVTRSTFAIGQSAVIAERTGITTVGDLRVRDVAAGGQGAPLIAYADWVLLRDAKLGRCVQNIGGIGNVTYLPPNATSEEVIAFDARLKKASLAIRHVMRAPDVIGVEEMENLPTLHERMQTTNARYLEAQAELLASTVDAGALASLARPVATAVNVHFAASTQNFFILEYHPDDESPRKDFLKEPLMVKDGYIPLPTKPEHATTCWLGLWRFRRGSTL